MKTSDLISRLESTVESHIQMAVEVFQNLPTSHLLRPSSTGGWSIAQCLEHLNSYGDYYLPEINKALVKSKNTNPKPTYKSGWFGAYFTKMMDPASAKKMKAFKNHIPPSDLDPDLVVARFIAQQEMMLSYLHRARKANIGSTRIPISLTKLVRLKTGDVFQFCVAHDARHIAQAKRDL